MLWLLGVGFIVFSPLPVDRHAGDLLRRGLAFVQGYGVPGWFDYGFVEFTANALMFLPLGLFFFLLAPRGWRWLGPVVAFGLSGLIEAVQLVALSQRVASPYDVAANTIGATAGTLLAWTMLRVRRHRR
ncbi:VanZ family protein [Arthrobacter sp. MDT1-48-3]